MKQVAGKGSDSSESERALYVRIADAPIIIGKALNNPFSAPNVAIARAFVQILSCTDQNSLFAIGSLQCTY